MDVSMRTRQHWAAEAIENGGAPTRPELQRRLSLLMDDSVMGLHAAAAVTAWPDNIRLGQVQVLAHLMCTGMGTGETECILERACILSRPCPCPCPYAIGFHWGCMRCAVNAPPLESNGVRAQY